MFNNNFNDNIKTVWTLKNYIYSRDSKTLIYIFFIVSFVFFFLT